MKRERAFDWWARAIPPRLLRAITLPINRHIRLDDGLRFDSAEMLNKALAYVANERLDGDYAEFGVLRGRTFVEAWYAVGRFELPNVKLHAYDSFEGLPVLAGPDRGGPFSAREFASSRSVFDASTAKIPPDRMTVTEGFFADSLPTAAKHPIAVAWIDCDLYESTVPVLDFLTDQLQDGAVLIFHDWFCFHGRPEKGEQRACAEWLEQHPEIRLVQFRDFSWSARSFLVNRD